MLGKEHVLGKCKLACLPRQKLPGARDFDNYLFWVSSKCLVQGSAQSYRLGPACQPVIKFEVALFAALLIWISSLAEGSVYLGSDL